MRPLAIGLTLALQASSTLPAMASDTVCAENASVISIKVDGGRMEWGVTVVDGETSSKTLMSTISLHSDEGKMMFLLLKDAERQSSMVTFRRSSGASCIGEGNVYWFNAITVD